jgi:dipeptidyl aminopeptidase/acylaminoacyl peptidase
MVAIAKAPTKLLRPIHISTLLLAAFSTVIGWASWVHAGEIPVEDLFQRPNYGAVRISPNGRYLAAVVRSRGRNNLEVIDPEKHEAKPITNFDDGDVLQFTWINNDRLVLAAGDAEEASGKLRLNGWYAVGRDGSNWQSLGGFSSFLGPASTGSNDIIVAARWRGASINDVYRLNTDTARNKLLSYDYPGEVLNWVVDRDGVPRVAHSYLKGIHSLWYRESDHAPWTKIDEGTEFRLHFTPLAFDYDNKTLYVAANRDGDKRAIYAYDFQRKKLGELVAASSQVDMETLIFSRARRALVGVSYQGDKPGVVWFDPDIARLQKVVDQALPDTYNALQIADENARRAVVFAYSDVNPGTIYLLDTDKLTLEELGKTRPWLDPKQLAERKPVHYTARDGLDISAYLTLPVGTGGRKPPLVVNIHGGPWVRGFVWGFDLQAQFFASRGYAVLEPEFRGSSGHGWKLLSAGFKQWGLAMQDDITDGVDWLIKQEVIDKDRVCLYGGSYGGYAALWGLIKTPELYKCGVAFVAVTDLNLLLDVNWLDSSRSPFLDYGAKDVIGDPSKDAENFRSVSPLVNAEKLRAPVLLAYGGSDRRVPIKHGNEFRAALDKYGKTYEWVVYRDEGHGFNKDANRFDFYRRVDAFLKKYLQ